MSHIPLEGIGQGPQTKVVSNTHMTGGAQAQSAWDRWAMTRSALCPGCADSVCLLWNSGEIAELRRSASSGSAWGCGDKAEAQKNRAKKNPSGAQLHPSEEASSLNLGDAPMPAPGGTQTGRHSSKGIESSGRAAGQRHSQGMPLRDRQTGQRNRDAACALTQRPAVPAQRSASPPTLLFYGKEMRRGGPGPALAAVQDGFKPERKQAV